MKGKYLLKKICSIALAVMLCVPASVSVYAAEDTLSVYENPGDQDNENQNQIDDADTGKDTADDNAGNGENSDGDDLVDNDRKENDIEDGKEDGASGIKNEDEANKDVADGEMSQLKKESVEENAKAVQTYSQGKADTKETLIYSAHVQSIGWQDEKQDGELAGTTGRKKRMEAIRIQVKSEPVEVKGQEENVETGGENVPGVMNSTGTEKEAQQTTGLTGTVEYQTHCQTYGWLDWTKDGQIGGTTGQSKRLEAIRIRLSGELAEKYDIYYRVHSSHFGDLGWAKNGQIAGTCGFGKSIEAISIKLVEKTATDKPEQNARSYYGKNDLGKVTYSSHCQSYGWLGNVSDGADSGTKGKGKRMEAIRIYPGTMYDENGEQVEGSIEYQTYCQSYGWLNWVKNGDIGGTTGQSKRMEAIRIRLTGALEEKYDVYYKVHCSRWGDLGWASNGQVAGTTGTWRSIESIQIWLVDKNDPNKPTSTNSPSIEMDKKGNIGYETYVENVGWTGAKVGTEISGTTGQKQKVVAVRMTFNGNTYSGGVTYRVYQEGIGWLDWVSDGAIAGTEGGNKRIEAIQVKLTGVISQYCDIYYSSHIQAYGWLGWAKNGESSGSNNCNYRLEAFRAALVAKTEPLPGSTSGAFQTTLYRKQLASFTTVSTNDANGTYNMTKALLSFNGRVINPGQTMSFFGVAGPCGAAQGYLPGGVVGGVGYGGGICQASTTLYGGALRAGLTVVERRNHSVPSTYVPIGQDAMVDYGSSDLKIRNDYGFPVTLKTYVTGRTLHVEIYGRDPGWFDSIAVNSWYTSGSSAAAERVFYKNGKIVKREALPSSFYY